MPQLNYIRHGLTTYKTYKGMEAWGWDVPRLNVRCEVIHATKAKNVNLINYDTREMFRVAPQGGSRETEWLWFILDI